MQRADRTDVSGSLEPEARASRNVDMTRAVVFLNTVGRLYKGAPYGTAQGTDGLMCDTVRAHHIVLSRC